MPERKIKGVKAIRIYVMEDQTRGVMWKVEPPASVKELFNKRWPKGYYCDDEEGLMKVVNQITEWKLPDK